MTDKLACPKCGSAAIALDDCYDVISGEGNTIKELCCGHCANCGADLQWEKVYKFVGYDEIEES
jgi:DNA-directed RNA polymerase subunit RPC12/RpoP